VLGDLSTCMHVEEGERCLSCGMLSWLGCRKKEEDDAVQVRMVAVAVAVAVTSTGKARLGSGQSRRPNRLSMVSRSPPSGLVRSCAWHHCEMHQSRQ
jgi:hypothetical protein